MPQIEGIIEGLQILAKYSPGEWCAAEHDTLYGPNAPEITEEDRERLVALGWFYEEGLLCWSCNV